METPSPPLLNRTGCWDVIRPRSGSRTQSNRRLTPPFRRSRAKPQCRGGQAGSFPVAIARQQREPTHRRRRAATSVFFPRSATLASGDLVSAGRTSFDLVWSRRAARPLLPIGTPALSRQERRAAGDDQSLPRCGVGVGDAAEQKIVNRRGHVDGVVLCGLFDSRGKVDGGPPRMSPSSGTRSLRRSSLLRTSDDLHWSGAWGVSCARCRSHGGAGRGVGRRRSA
jgi:hypothetical protein